MNFAFIMAVLEDICVERSYLFKGYCISYGFRNVRRNWKLAKIGMQDSKDFEKCSTMEVV